MSEELAERGLDWYHDDLLRPRHLRAAAAARRAPATSRIPEAATRRGCACWASAEIVVQLRDPVTRAVSNWRFSTTARAGGPPARARPLRRTSPVPETGTRRRRRSRRSPTSSVDGTSTTWQPWFATFRQGRACAVPGGAGRATVVDQRPVRRPGCRRCTTGLLRLNDWSTRATAHHPDSVRSSDELLREYFRDSDEQLRNGWAESCRGRGSHWIRVGDVRCAGVRTHDRLSNEGQATMQ